MLSEHTANIFVTRISTCWSFVKLWEENLIFKHYICMDFIIRWSSLCNRLRRFIGGVEVELYSFFNLGARWGGWLTPRPGRFTLGNNLVPIVQEADWAPGLIWTVAEIRNHLHSIPGPSSPQRVAIPATLFRHTTFIIQLLKSGTSVTDVTITQL